MTQGEAVRLRIFRQYSPNLGLWKPELEGRYMCPLCLRDDFTEESVMGLDPVLTEEHCIPRNLGRKISTLTCKDCNNSKGGSGVDAALYERMDFEDFLAGKPGAKFQTRLHKFGRSVGVELERRTAEGDEGLTLHAIKKNTNKADLDHVAEQFAELKKEVGDTVPVPFPIDLSPKRLPNLARSRTSILKAGYLLAFRHFGYAYILSDILDPVRKQIQEPEGSHVPLQEILFRAPLELIPGAITEVTEPVGLMGFAVPIEMSKRGSAQLVILPTDAETYKRWADFYQKANKPESLEIRLSTPIPFRREFLTSKAFNWMPREFPILDDADAAE